MRWPWSPATPRLTRRNYPPAHGIRLPLGELESFLTAIFRRAGLDAPNAGLLSGILTRNTQRCVYSHGIGAVPQYLEKIETGAVNPRPRVSVVSESDGALVLDGDGGLGHFACWQGTEWAVGKAKEIGIAAVTTRNHDHIGAAGTYALRATDDGCIGWTFSSQRAFLEPGAMVYDVVDASPISIAIPAGREPPLVVDMGGHLLRYDNELFRRLPSAFLKTMALSSAIRALGGVFAGVYRRDHLDSDWDAEQGAFIGVIDVAHFLPLDELRREMDRFIGEARQSRPLPGLEYAELAGGNEWRWAGEAAAQGIPLSDEHRRTLQAEADRLGVEAPFRRFEHTRF